MKIFKLSLIVGLLFLVAGCASAPSPREAACPDWVNQGSGAYGDGKDSVFYGVGLSSGIKDPALRRLTADNRAIADIARVFDVYVASLMKDYMASTSADDRSSEEKHVESIQKTVVKQTLNGVKIVDHCNDKGEGIYYSLAKLDLDDFKDSVEKKGQLSDRMKEYVKANANRLYDDLEKEETKR